MNRKSALPIVIVIIILSSTLAVYAEQVPGTVLAVETNPFYFSDGGMGIGILKFYERPLTPYLVPGKTTEQSSIAEIYDAYNENTKNTAQNSIVDDKDRVITFVTEFSNGDLEDPLVFNTFTKFTHIAKDAPADTPYYYQNIQYGLELESLPSTDRKPFYDLLVQPSINPGKKPEPFDVTIRFLTGNGDVLQTWRYQDCEITAYTPYLDENLIKIKFVGAFVSEIRDKTSFSCGGFAEDFVLKEESKKPEQPLVQILPEKTTRASRIIAQFSGGDFPTTATFYSFSKFLPLVKDPSSGLPISVPGNVIGEKPQFLLESLPTKDKEGYYKQISRYVNPGPIPQPFEATIHLVTDSGKILQSWKYSDCSASNYSVFFLDNLLFYKFKQTLGSEIREKTFFECAGLEFNPEDLGAVKTDEVFVPDDNSRAQIFVVHFEGADISPVKTLTSFTKFAPITHEERAMLFPNAPFGEAPKFYLSSLPSKDNGWYYELMSRYINSGKIPKPFDVTVDVILGDGTKLQTWKYSDCQVLEFKSFLENTLILRKFTNEFEVEVRDRTIFECAGLEFDGASYAPEKAPAAPLDYADFIPTGDERVKNVVATFSGGELMQSFTIYTVGKFQPKMEQRSQTQTQFVRLDVTIVPDAESDADSKSGPPDYCGPGQSPPGCRPCPPNNPHCPESPTEPPVDPPVEPSEPGINPTYTIHVTKPHLSTIQKNDYIKSTEFTIETLPSKDKMQYYGMVEKYINPGKKPEPFDVKFDYVTGDGTVIQTWDYADCRLIDFKIKLRDSLVFLTMSGAKAQTEIADLSTFSCNGFSMNAKQHESNEDSIVAIPSPYDRAMMHVIHWYGGELSGQRSTALVQEFESLPDSSLFLGGLPSIYHKDVYEFISRYVNPEKPPEPIDMRVDTLTGDGTVLFSTIYSDCTIKDAAIHLIDRMDTIHYAPGLRSEVRGQSISDCTGVNFKTAPQSDPKFDIMGNMRKISPVVQTAIGVSEGDVSCNEGLSLMIRPPKNVPICVKSDSISQFEKRGWEVATVDEAKKLIDVLRPIISTEAERAQSFTISFEGSDIAPPQIVKTFSKFVPIADENAIIQKPSNPLNPSKVSFYLESLSSKDKGWYYELASRYVNPGAKPEKFNVSVQINTGDGIELQNWKYRNCEITEFVTYYDDLLLRWKFHEKWQSEFKDKSIFSCDGLSIT